MADVPGSGGAAQTTRRGRVVVRPKPLVLEQVQPPARVRPRASSKRHHSSVGASGPVNTPGRRYDVSVPLWSESDTETDEDEITPRLLGKLHASGLPELSEGEETDLSDDDNDTADTVHASNRAVSAARTGDAPLLMRLAQRSPASAAAAAPAGRNPRPQTGKSARIPAHLRVSFSSFLPQLAGRTGDQDNRTPVLASSFLRDSQAMLLQALQQLQNQVTAAHKQTNVAPDATLTEHLHKAVAGLSQCISVSKAAEMDSAALAQIQQDVYQRCSGLQRQMQVSILNLGFTNGSAGTAAERQQRVAGAGTPGKPGWAHLLAGVVPGPIPTHVHPLLQQGEQRKRSEAEARAAMTAALHPVPGRSSAVVSAVPVASAATTSESIVASAVLPTSTNSRSTSAGNINFRGRKRKMAGLLGPEDIVEMPAPKRPGPVPLRLRVAEAYPPAVPGKSSISQATTAAAETQAVRTASDAAAGQSVPPIAQSGGSAGQDVLLSTAERGAQPDAVSGRYDVVMEPGAASSSATHQYDEASVTRETHRQDDVGDGAGDDADDVAPYVELPDEDVSRPDGAQLQAACDTDNTDKPSMEDDDALMPFVDILAAQDAGQDIV